MCVSVCVTRLRWKGTEMLDCATVVGVHHSHNGQERGLAEGQRETCVAAQFATEASPESVWRVGLQFARGGTLT